jgi:hypothetical protein
MTYQEFTDYVAGKGRWLYGDQVPDQVAWEWLCTGIPLSVCVAFIEAGTFEPSAALAMVREDLTPYHAGIKASYGGEEKTVGYWLSNGDYSIKDVNVLLAIQGEIDRKMVPYV